MALTINGAGSANSTTSSATLSTSAFIQTWSNPDLIVVCVAADNNGTNGAASISSVTDSKGHTYTQRQIQNQDPSTAASGATVAIYTAVATTGLTNGDTITVNFSPNTTAKAMYVWRVSAASTEFVKYVTAGGAVGATANPTVTTVSITSGNAMIGALASESNVTPTADTDTTGGSWAGHTNATANTGTAATSMNVHTGYKITTATGTQTWNQTLVANDWANAYIVLNPAARVNRTATGSGLGSGTASGFETLSRVATGSGAGTETASGNRFAVVSQTATGSGAGAATATGVRTALRTATGAGAGSQSAASIRSVLQTATGSGTGSGTATGNVILGSPTHQRTATGSGTGSATASCVATRLRTATGSGSSGFDSFGLVTRRRTATGTGTGTSSTVSVGGTSRTATGSGVGSSSVTISTVRIRTAVGSGVSAGTAIWSAVVSRFGLDFAVGHGQAVGERVFTLEVPPWPRPFPKHFYPAASKPAAKSRPLRPPRVRW